MPDRKRIGGVSLLEQLPTERLVDQCYQLLGLLADQAIEKAFDSVDGLTDRLLDYAHHGGPGLINAITGGGARGEEEPSKDKPPLRESVKYGVTKVSASVKHAFAGLSGSDRGGVAGSDRDGSAARTMNIAEHIDLGVPVRLAYDRWIRFPDFSQFMKMAGMVDTSAGTANGKTQTYCSYPDWDTTIIEQVPDERIVWRSRGARGRVDGAVSFHAMTPNMTRILLAIEYHPQGVLERAGKLWRAQDRRVRLEIKQFQCQVMTRVLLDADSKPGRPGEIRDGAVVRGPTEAAAGEDHEPDEPGKNQGPSAAPDAPAEDCLDAAEENHDDDSDAPAEETEDYDDAYDYADDVDDEYDEDEVDDEYDDEPEREYVPAGRR